MKGMSQHVENNHPKNNFLKQVIYMIGLPGVGKTTVGKLIAKRTGFVLLDHNIMYKEICCFLEKGTYAAHLLNGRMHLVIMNLLLMQSPIPGIICTMSIRYEPTSQTVRNATRMIKHAGAKVNFVKLECDWNEHKRRILMPSRQGLNKTNTVAKLKKYMNGACFNGLKKFPPLVINNTRLPANKCAKKIINAFGLPERTPAR
ncbi:TPA: hypothetical protein DEQ22_01370 [Candidatus Nomurabacteria bacterium]|uniref:Shikimate kinase n=2 Tax=Candidatus Nomuraibacteriota TaxID=1752729 RepID=A0A1F6YMF5_9BACT|nr:MAG: hypothetical protein UV13_C0003G0005 [Parcubacteria group bacterium GW2011_GWC1_42_21]KKS58523.1 MAG: hypothetical protein UV23_C0005G0005 [Candidatus Nomurabacteria bacterium GW2011_GWF1_42_40]KKT00212.1 MAG: hypothetical protein UV77_C0006G0079 [Candidatus Nomurabacteria bacterium GW2011_GWA1_43_17]KKT07754.1 MAG: hypothetical protein UV85_C0005G0005 [Candidatus Nomurabacteria bacterium GW2011_GWB1_43_19]KKT11662.1 MAG: hypothetical protein UV91_C0003G0051 [Candidatus Nomurabacteria b